MNFDGSYLLDAGWVFFAGWSLVVCAVSWIAFRTDLRPSLLSPSTKSIIKPKAR
jgi:hypothetical protein